MSNSKSGSKSVSGSGETEGTGVSDATRLEGLSHRAKVFRSKLIEDFQILETTSESGKRKVPVYSTTDILSKTLR